MMWVEGILCLVIAGLIASSIELFRLARTTVLYYVGFGISLFLAAVCLFIVVNRLQEYRTPQSSVRAIVPSFVPIRDRRPQSSVRSIVTPYVPIRDRRPQSSVRSIVPSSYVSRNNLPDETI